MQTDRKVEELHVEYRGKASQAQESLDQLADAVEAHDEKQEVCKVPEEEHAE